MSGIVGMLHTDGAPVDAGLLGQLTQFLSFRGPDARQTWTAASIGFGHTLLRTTHESARENQPFTLDGKTWIVADARVDAHQELLAQLRSKGQEVPSSATDPELILRAYQAWGEQCVDHLLGDFVFAIWDAPRQRLFCARDHFGVKPFFYAHLGSLFLFSNTLDCIRQHSAVSDKLNDLAIADFLLFDMNQDPATTTFTDIQRLPPAHTLTCEAGRISVRRYWTLSVTEPVHFRRDEEYIERFLELLDTAVSDRLRTDSAGVLMSGGLDSPTVAASAKRVFARDGNDTGLRAYTEVFDSLIPHEERHYATLVAKALNIPIEFHVGDNVRLFGHALQPGYHTPEPQHCAWPDSTAEQLRRVAEHSRVALTGFGADPALSCRITLHFRHLLKSRHFYLALRDAIRYLAAENRFSRLYLRVRLRILLKPKSAAPSYPPWLNEQFERRLGLRERWQDLNCSAKAPAGVRSVAWEAAVASMWPHLFEAYDPALTLIPVEARHPFFDLRLLHFLMALPTLPWCSDKEILREAARNVLPDTVRVRRKSPLLADPLNSLLQQPVSVGIVDFGQLRETGEYVVRDRVPPIMKEKQPWPSWIHLRPLSLNFWLWGSYASVINAKGGFHEIEPANHFKEGLSEAKPQGIREH